MFGWGGVGWCEVWCGGGGGDRIDLNFEFHATDNVFGPGSPMCNAGGGGGNLIEVVIITQMCIYDSMM